MVCWLFCHGCVVQSLNGFLSGVENFCRSEGLPRLPRGIRFKQARTGIQNIFGQVDIQSPAVGLTTKDLLRLRTGINFRKLADVRFWCQTLLGFQGLLRASEVLRLRVEDFLFTPWGVQVVVPYSKTDLTPTPVGLVTRGDLLCPTAAFATLFRLLGKVGPKTKLFAQSYNEFNSELQLRCRRMGVIVFGVSTHSLRRGGCTALFFAGVPVESIMAHGRWTSSAWRKYIDFNVRLQQLPTRMLLLSPDL